MINNDELDIISYLCAVQEDRYFCFQRVTKKQLLIKKRIVFSDPVKFEDNTREIVVNSIPDAIYCCLTDRLYFKKLSSITAIFPGIEEIFREATKEETNIFLESEFIVITGTYNADSVKQPNRKRIALAQKALAEYDEQQKAAVLESIREYYPSIINDENTFKIESDEDLTYLLYGIMQRYYTTADGREKCIASSVRKL